LRTYTVNSQQRAERHDNHMPPKKKKKKKAKGKNKGSKKKNSSTTNFTEPSAPSDKVTPPPPSRPEESEFYYLVDFAKGNVATGLSKRKVVFLEKARVNMLTLRDISEHQLYINKVIGEMNCAKEYLKRKHTITQAMLKRTTEPKRRRVLEGKLQHFRKRETYFNQNVKIINSEIDWFHKSTAFKQAQQHVLTNWQQSKNGSWINKQELVEDEDSMMDFDSLLQSFKMEDKEGGSISSSGVNNESSSGGDSGGGNGCVSGSSFGVDMDLNDHMRKMKLGGAKVMTYEENNMAHTLAMLRKNGCKVNGT